MCSWPFADVFRFGFALRFEGRRWDGLCFRAITKHYRTFSFLSFSTPQKRALSIWNAFKPVLSNWPSISTAKQNKLTETAQITIRMCVCGFFLWKLPLITHIWFGYRFILPSIWLEHVLRYTEPVSAMTHTVRATESESWRKCLSTLTLTHLPHVPNKTIALKQIPSHKGNTGSYWKWMQWLAEILPSWKILPNSTDDVLSSALAPNLSTSYSHGTPTYVVRCDSDKCHTNCRKHSVLQPRRLQW